jgi:hypothetical protein
MDRLRAAPHAAAARPLVGGLILGSFWALWHLPGFLIPSQKLTDIPPRGTVVDFVVFALALIGLRLVIMWVVNIHPNSYEWKFVPVAGKTFTDSGTSDCH